MDQLGVRPKGVFYRQNAELDIIRDLKNLTLRYTKIKENITDVKPEDRNLSYLDPEFPNELDTSLKQIISGIITQGDKDKDGESDDASKIKTLKQKAMTAKVKAIRHREGVSTRSQSNSFESDIKSPPGKVKTLSPKRVATTVKRKTNNKKRPSRKRVRKPKANPSETGSDDDYTIKNDSDIDTNDDTQCDDLDLSQFDLVEAENSQCSSNGQDLNIKIDTLPCFIRSENQGNTYEIEIIDQMNAADQNIEDNYNLEQPTPSTSGILGGDRKNKMDKRDLKKTIVKSRFKRMGMLPVANFETK